MSCQVDNIVIIGGGSSGWITATTLKSVFPEKTITVIESPDHPIIGVGESTIGGINSWLQLVGIRHEDFMAFTDATFKLSIKFTNFYTKNSGSFHYPFGPSNSQGSYAGRNDWYMKKAAYPDTPLSDYAESMYPQMALVNENKIHPDVQLPGFVFERDAVYHFDAIRFAIWLRDMYCLPRGVEYKLGTVTNASVSENGIDYVVLDNGEQVTADLFIDCTGFKSLLLGEYLKEPFTSYENILPNNSAWAAQLPYVDKRKQLTCYTECEAIDNGWVWTIPLWSRIGSGYVYSDKYISDEMALDEFKAHLKSKGQATEDLKFKKLKMRVGIHERLWVKNVCAIGLAAGFIEPLESSGLFTVHEFAIKLARTLARGAVSQWDKDAFSQACVTQFKEFSEFVALHYALSHRDDTEYWRAVGKRSYVGSYKAGEFEPYTLKGFNNAIDARHRLFNYGQDEEGGGFNCIASGMNYFPMDIYSVTAYSFPRNTDWICVFKEAAAKLDEKKAAWKSIVGNTPSVYDYLNEKIYK